MLSYAHMNSFIFQVNTPDILGMVLEFETMFFVDLVERNIYCNGGKFMF